MAAITSCAYMYVPYVHIIVEGLILTTIYTTTMYGENKIKDSPSEMKTSLHTVKHISASIY